MKKMPCACTIAGSDSGGGAGIQADLKTFTALGVWGCSSVTAITAQNTVEVAGVWPLPPEVVAAQIESILSDFPVGAFKTGMLANAGIIHAIASSLPDSVPLIVDPVMVATSGARLLSEDAVSALIRELLPRTLLVTPNIAEAAVLSGGCPVETEEEREEAAHRILSLGAGAVLITGGHLSGREAVDLYVDNSRTKRMIHPRLPYEVHGSGCCLSAAIAAYCARGQSLIDACGHGAEFTAGAIGRAAVSKTGHRMVRP